MVKQNRKELFYFSVLVALVCFLASINSDYNKLVSDCGKVNKVEICKVLNQ